MLNPTVDVKAWIDARPVSKYLWLILGLCFLVVLFDGFDVAVMGFIAPSLMQEWGLSRAAFGPVMSAGMVGLAMSLYRLHMIGAVLHRSLRSLEHAIG